MTVREVSLAIKGKDRALERDYNLTFLACYNASGAINGGKKFKIVNPFDSKKATKYVPNAKDRDDTIAFLESFNK